MARRSCCCATPGANHGVKPDTAGCPTLRWLSSVAAPGSSKLTSIRSHRYTAPRRAAVRGRRAGPRGVRRTWHARSMQPLVRPQVHDAYWRFAARRHEIFLRRTRGDSEPWSDDVILQRFKFCNTFRATDRVSQYLIREVIYGPHGKDLDPEDIFLPYRPVPTLLQGGDVGRASRRRRAGSVARPLTSAGSAIS